MSMDGDIVLVPIELTGRIPGLGKMGPKEADHHTIGGMCLLCQQQFVANCYTTLLPLGPGGDQESRTLARAGRPYVGIVMEVHWECATGEPGAEIIVPGSRTTSVCPKKFANARRAHSVRPGPPSWSIAAIRLHGYCS